MGRCILHALVGDGRVGAVALEHPRGVLVGDSHLLLDRLRRELLVVAGLGIQSGVLRRVVED